MPRFVGGGSIFPQPAYSQLPSRRLNPQSWWREMIVTAIALAETLKREVRFDRCLFHNTAKVPDGAGKGYWLAPQPRVSERTTLSQARG